MFSYSFLPVLLLILYGIILYIKIKLGKKEKREIVLYESQNLNAIKNNYLQKINVLTNKVNSGKITNRKAYQTLSNIIRNFIYETTNIRVQNYTLKEIENLNMPILYELIKEYYNPEFSKNIKGNILSSIEKTEKVIHKWN